MKLEKGITLTSLVLYIILLMLVLSILFLISDYFYKNLNYVADIGKYVANYNKFNMYFIEDVKNNSEIYSITDQGHKLVFIDGTVYTFDNKSIYRNKSRICENIHDLSFRQSEHTDENNFTKKTVIVEMTIKGSKPLESENEYVLKYW